MGLYVECESGGKPIYRHPNLCRHYQVCLRKKCMKFGALEQIKILSWHEKPCCNPILILSWVWRINELRNHPFLNTLAFKSHWMVKKMHHLKKLLLHEDINMGSFTKLAAKSWTRLICKSKLLKNFWKQNHPHPQAVCKFYYFIFFVLCGIKLSMFCTVAVKN